MGCLTSGGGNRHSVSINLGSKRPMVRRRLAGDRKEHLHQFIRIPEWHHVTIDSDGNIYRSPLLKEQEKTGNKCGPIKRAVRQLSLFLLLLTASVAQGQGLVSGNSEVKAFNRESVFNAVLTTNNLTWSDGNVTFSLAPYDEYHTGCSLTIARRDKRLGENVSGRVPIAFGISRPISLSGYRQCWFSNRDEERWAGKIELALWESGSGLKSDPLTADQAKQIFSHDKVLVCYTASLEVPAGERADFDSKLTDFIAMIRQHDELAVVKNRQRVAEENRIRGIQISAEELATKYHQDRMQHDRVIDRKADELSLEFDEADREIFVAAYKHAARMPSQERQEEIQKLLEQVRNVPDAATARRKYAKSRRSSGRELIRAVTELEKLQRIGVVRFYGLDSDPRWWWSEEFEKEVTPYKNRKPHVWPGGIVR